MVLIFLVPHVYKGGVGAARHRGRLQLRNDFHGHPGVVDDFSVVLEDVLDRVLGVNPVLDRLRPGKEPVETSYMRVCRRPSVLRCHFNYRHCADWRIDDRPWGAKTS